MSFSSSPVVMRWYRLRDPPQRLIASLNEALEAVAGSRDVRVVSVRTEHCFNVEVDDPSTLREDRLEWLLGETFDRASLSKGASHFAHSEGDKDKKAAVVVVLEFGPRSTFTTPFSSNATEICRACGVGGGADRLERSRRYEITLDRAADATVVETLCGALHDRMTEERYETPRDSFSSTNEPEPVREIPVMERGKAALEELNEERGLGFDDFDLDYYTDLFQSKLGRNPTDVECFDMGQSNSEHSRHWFFGGRMVIDGEEKSDTLFRMVKDTLVHKDNSVIAYHDNSSAIRGFKGKQLVPSDPSRASPATLVERVGHPLLTAETHNFPCGVAPFPGAETGTGGRLRDVLATGRGARFTAGVCGYCVGNLRLPGADAPWESTDFDYPSNLASPLDILVKASDGASDYGNKFGEPVPLGFARSYGDRHDGGERREWVKPIMFSAGVGLLDGAHVDKGEPEIGMCVVKIGGPAYRIGIGGGAASSRVQTGDDQKQADLDFDAVQRGDAEMENRMARLMRACCDLGDANPIVSCHDQGAGGNGNVLKEIVEPAGARYDVRKVYVGDDTLSVLEIWGAEYQENNALLIRPESEQLFRSLAERENCPYRVLGHVTGDGRVVLEDSRDGSTPVDLPLELVLGKMPQKTFVDATLPAPVAPLKLPPGTTPMDAAKRVLRCLSVGSKRFLVHKVDRSVTGLVAQQQCVGPLQLPLADCAVVAHSHFGVTGTVTACGEAPAVGLLSPAAMARRVVAEVLTNLCLARVTSLTDVKCSANWMYAAKLPGEAAQMYEACSALKECLLAVGVGVDGGKDSLSMAARCGREIVKAPGALVLTCYAACPDVTHKITPDLACVERRRSTKLLFVDLGGGRSRVGGSVLAQVYNALGDECPDVDPVVLRHAFETTQRLLVRGDETPLLAGHDVSDGGLATTVAEMAFAAGEGCSVKVRLTERPGVSDVERLFSEEAGLVLEVAPERVDEVLTAYHEKGVPCDVIGDALPDGDEISFTVGDASAPCLVEKTTALRDLWEETSFRLERLQRNPVCVDTEQRNLKHRKTPRWRLTYEPAAPPPVNPATPKHAVAVLRQEGSNGDREMLAALTAANLEAWDVTVGDLARGDVVLDRFRGVVFVGGFSYADVLDSGKGWAGAIRFDDDLRAQFEAFRTRPDTFSLGVCNGCQLMALLGWVPFSDSPLSDDRQPRLLENVSEKFESRLSTVTIPENTPAVLFKGMEGSVLGVWVAHGEGRFHFPDNDVRQEVLRDGRAPLRYADDDGRPTEEYPFNPNGSPDGIAALCSENGRHLAMMPHPERLFLPWQWPWTPRDWKNHPVGAWARMFQNAKTFCDNTAQ